MRIGRSARRPLRSLSLAVLLGGVLSLVVVARAGAAGSTSTVTSSQTTASTVPVTPATAGQALPPRLQVSGAALMVEGSGEWLFGTHADGELAIASTTKIMTALVTLEHVHDLAQSFTQNDWYPAAQDSQIGLIPGERMSVHDLLLALMLPSADDAAEDLAYNVGDGSVSRFVGMMNAEARRLGLTHTHYSTPIGLDTPGNYSSPRDLDRLTAYVLGYSAFLRRIVALPSAVLKTGRIRRAVVNRNDLVARYHWIEGVKTGHTNDAGYVLVISGRRNGMTLIGDVLGTTSEAARDENALALIDYGFAAFHIVEEVREGQVLARPGIRDRPGHHAVVVAAAGFKQVLPRSDHLSVRVEVPRELTGPLPEHAVVGQASVLANGRSLARIPLLLARAIPAISPLTQVGRFLSRTSTLIVVALLLGGIGIATIWRRRAGALTGRHLEEG